MTEAIVWLDSFSFWSVKRTAGRIEIVVRVGDLPNRTIVRASGLTFRDAYERVRAKVLGGMKQDGQSLRLAR